MKRVYIILGLACLFAACSHRPYKSLSGQYHSKKGVKSPVSCYCFHGGYLTTEGGERIAVCFQDEKKSDIPCDTVSLQGYYETKSISPAANSPCPAGEMKLFYVVSYSCE